MNFCNKIPFNSTSTHGLKLSPTTMPNFYTLCQKSNANLQAQNQNMSLNIGEIGAWFDS